VYCEKPIAGTYFDGKAMCDAAKETGNKLHIQLGTLYRKETKAAKALIDDGRLGKLYHARSTGHRRRGRPYVDGYGTQFFTRKEFATGGAILDMGVYHIAQLLYLLGNPGVKRITGKMYQEMDMDEARRRESGFDVEELGTGFVTMENGITLDIIEAWSIHLGGFEGSSIVGSLGGIRLPAFSNSSATSNTFSFHSTISDIDFESYPDLNAMDIRWNRLRENQDAYESSQNHWIAALQGRVELALQTMLISEGLYLSDRLGREVTAEEVMDNSESKGHM
jgi:predicted dehydrogenase